MIMVQETETERDRIGSSRVGPSQYEPLLPMSVSPEPRAGVPVLWRTDEHKPYRNKTKSGPLDRPSAKGPPRDRCHTYGVRTPGVSKSICFGSTVSLTTTFVDDLLSPVGLERDPRCQTRIRRHLSLTQLPSTSVWSVMKYTLRRGTPLWGFFRRSMCSLKSTPGYGVGTV